ncbi:endonuclease/exonuclease/phosphatase family protein [Marivita sp. S6314]|uniref:endonuclease/exonuclease/phosphatase family protein n=1 Tax=Marivita sp. S6314 TaxID=2926406 RepID=UPI001FF526C8|nr:endonuclease/exonuclease/phosphatase family protein [Marivita sp. S6314]MCK0150990.1 endonuclease/exonuclease/phosphatase family protein [Marivita sp. S6314]
MRWAVKSVAAVLAAGFFGSFAGALHPLGDSLAVFRLPIAVLFALWVIWSPWPYWIRWSVAVLCLGAMGQIVALKYVSPPAGPVVVYQKNLLFQNDQVAALVADIRSANPDIVALQELTSRNADVVRTLRPDYPHQASCALTSWARVAILSKWPVEGEICIEDQGLVGIQIASPDGTFWAFSLHAFWPWPHGQDRQLAQLLPVLEGLEDPIVLAGDFNMVPWSFALNQIARTTQTTRAGPLFPTLIKMGAPLPIDHVYAPGGGRASQRDLLGSDHSGVLAEVVVFE